MARGDDDGAVAATVLTVVSIGSMMAAFGRVTRVNRELRETREELATLAVAEERLRIARDVHDLLGHSLSVITLKSELAARLLERDPARAAGELEEIQAVSREALAEVREAVKGYRGLALAESLDARALGARRGRHRLRARRRAARRCRRTSTPCSPGPCARAPRTSSATARPATARSASAPTTRAPRSRSTTTAARPPAPGHGGSGLDGLRERAQRVRGTLEAGARPEGGFRLRVTVPLAGP